MFKDLWKDVLTIQGYNTQHSGRVAKALNKICRTDYFSWRSHQMCSI
jgi:hypothetical protein